MSVSVLTATATAQHVIATAQHVITTAQHVITTAQHVTATAETATIAEASEDRTGTATAYHWYRGRQ